MTLDEAISHAEEVADRCALTDGSQKCEIEHRQLAAWLKELRFYKTGAKKVDLRGHDLSGIDLSCTNLTGANFSGACLWGADFHYADMMGARISGVRNAPLYPYVCPDYGAFVGWKKAFVNDLTVPVIVQLEITEDARRLSGSSRRCRCDKAKVLSIKSLDGETDYKEAESGCWFDFHNYKVGEMVIASEFEENRWKNLGEGIHFFINRQEAVDYGL